MLGVLGTLRGSAQGANEKALLPQSREALTAEGKNEFYAGHYGAALDLYRRAVEMARKDGDLKTETTGLVAEGACELFLFQYRAALSSAENAHSKALRIHNDFLAGVAAGNLSTIYMQLGDFAQSRESAAEAVSRFEKTNANLQLVQALVNSAYLIENDPTKALRLSDRAIAVARQAGLKQIEAFAWDARAALLLKDDGRVGSSESLKALEQAVAHAYALRKQIHDDDGLGLTNEHRAELAYAQRRYPEALNIINDAFAASTATFRSSPAFYPIHVRARILLALGREREALAGFKNAVEVADQWRLGALPGDSTNSRTVSMLNAVYQDYVEAAAAHALRAHDSALSEDAFEALADNRAASLREQVVLSLGRDFRLPPRYYEELARLKSLQARVTLGQKTDSDVAELRTVRLELERISNNSWLEHFNSSIGENSSVRKSLKDIRDRLSERDVLLSFCLGEKQSFLWSITKRDFNLYSIAGKVAIEQQAKLFSDAVQNGKDSAIIGSALRNMLFSQLSPSANNKQEWMITADGALLNGIPFSALPSDQKTPLVNRHTLRFLPSERLLLVNEGTSPRNLFVGVGDPIYNLADSRLPSSFSLMQVAQASGQPITLARLVSSAREVRSAATESALPKSSLLIGEAASGESLRSLLAQKPKIIHFAVHVVSPQGHPEEAALALSLGKDGVPELLTSEAIATYRVPGSLVILSGCSSQQGEAVPGAGLLGLSRAWLLAGASAVVVSSWPTPDDSGQFFSSFYKHFAVATKASTTPTDSLGQEAAAALQQAQIDMQRTPRYRNAPAFWAAYSVISKE